jgi:hypothetical protein
MTTSGCTVSKRRQVEAQLRVLTLVLFIQHRMFFHLGPVLPLRLAARVEQRFRNPGEQVRRVGSVLLRICKGLLHTKFRPTYAFHERSKPSNIVACVS